MPPEQADGRIDEVDEQSDIWALGAILYALLCHEAPHTGKTLHNVLASAAKGDVQLPTRRAPHLSIPRELEAVCMKCLTSSKGGRYESVDDLVADVQAYLDSRLVSAYRYNLMERFFRFVQRHPSASVGAGVALLLLVLGGTLATFIIQQAHIARLRAEKAETEAKAATSLLAKGRRVSSLLQSARINLASVLRRLESRRHARQAGDKKTPKKHKEKIERFEARVPDDTASRSAWLALKGWLSHLAGDEDAAAALFTASTETDPDVVYGRLFEAMTAADRFLSAQRMPKLDQSGGSFRIREVTQETDEIRILRERFEASLDAVSSSSVWGVMSGDEFSAVLDGLRGLRGGEPEKAESALTRALAIPEMSWLETDLLLARAKIREMLGRLDDMEDDLALIRGRFPDHNRARYFLGRLRLGQARIIMARRRDSRPRYLQALALFEEAVKVDPADYAAQGHRALVNLLLARIHAHRAMAYKDNFEQAVADFTALAKAYPEDLDHLINRAFAFREWGAILVSDKEDGLPTLRRSLDDYTELIKLKPESPRWYAYRAGVHLRLAWAKSQESGDLGGSLAAARNDAEKSVALSPDKTKQLGPLAQILVAQAQWRMSKGEDVHEDYEKAIGYLSAMLAQKPDSASLLLSRGGAYRALSDCMVRSGKNGREAITLAVKDLRSATAKDPRSSHCRSMLANALLSMSALDADAGRDITALVKEVVTLYSQCVGFSPGVWDYRLRRVSVRVQHLDLLAKTPAKKRGILESCIADCDFIRKKAPRLLSALKLRASLFLRIAQTSQDCREDEVRSRLNAGLADCDEYIRQCPKSVNTRLTRAEILLLLGRTPEALATLEEAKPFATSPEHAKALKELFARIREAEKK